MDTFRKEEFKKAIKRHIKKYMKDSKKPKCCKFLNGGHKQ